VSGVPSLALFDISPQASSSVNVQDSNRRSPNSAAALPIHTSPVSTDRNDLPTEYIAVAYETMPYTNYVAFKDLQTGRDRVGHYDLITQSIQPLSFQSGTPLGNLYQVIEVGEANIAPAGPALPASSVKILPPFAERDVLCVGKNYAEHAKEFNSSGFDSSDKVDTPSHPVIFIKRFTSIIAHEEEIYPHTEFTKTADYEGEIGVIIGRPAFRVSEEDAMSFVWGYTIVNDMTARERQRDHKQFYLGKSPDTYCPMVCGLS
jgi:hypothetical protein